MKIGFLCRHDPEDKYSFSGTAYYAYKALREIAAEDDSLQVISVGKYGSSYRRILSRILGQKKQEVDVEFRDLDTDSFDWIVSLVSGEIGIRAGQHFHAPVVHVTDATPRFLFEFYGDAIDGDDHAAEAKVIEQAARVIYSSHFMRDRAATEFGSQFAIKFGVIPFGVNLDEPPKCVKELNFDPELQEPVQLLFIGRDWLRKGGPLTIETLLKLRADGVPANLSIVGCDPEDVQGILGVEVYPFLDKNKESDRAVFDRLFSQSHLLLLPTRADCTPMVIAEANANSLPVIATDVGGIGTLVHPGKNGALLDLNADATEWAAAVRSLTVSSLSYNDLRRSAFAHFTQVLNWSSWSRELVKDLKRFNAIAPTSKFNTSHN